MGGTVSVGGVSVTGTGGLEATVFVAGMGTGKGESGPETGTFDDRGRGRTGGTSGASAGLSVGSGSAVAGGGGATGSGGGREDGSGGGGDAGSEGGKEVGNGGGSLEGRGGGSEAGTGGTGSGGGTVGVDAATTFTGFSNFSGALLLFETVACFMAAVIGLV